LGAPIWPPNPPRSSRPGEAGALLYDRDFASCSGEAGALLYCRYSGALRDYFASWKMMPRV